MAAWDTSGRQLWATFVEPPWSYDVVEGVVHLDVMAYQASFPVESGPAWDKVPWLARGHPFRA
jgi:hypothetical protein